MFVRKPSASVPLHISRSETPDLPHLVTPEEAANALCRSTATLKRWRYDGVGPDWVVINGRVSYDSASLAEFIRQGKRVPSVRAAKEKPRDAV